MKRKRVSKRETMLGHIAYDYQDIEVLSGTCFYIGNVKCDAKAVLEGLEVTFDAYSITEAAAYKAAVDAKIASQYASRQKAAELNHQVQSLIKKTHASAEAAADHLPDIAKLILEQGEHERAARDNTVEYEVEKVYLQAVLPPFALVTVSGIDQEMMWVPNNEPPDVVATKRIVEVVREKNTFDSVQWEAKLHKRTATDLLRSGFISVAAFDSLVYVATRNRVSIFNDWHDLVLADMRVFNDEVSITCLCVDASHIYLVDLDTNVVFAAPREGGLSTPVLVRDKSLEPIRGIAVADAVLLVVTGTDEVGLYHKSTGSLLQKWTLALALCSRKLSSVAVFKHEVFVLDIELNEIIVLNLVTGKVLRMFDVDSDLHGLIGHIAVDGKSIFLPVGKTVRQLDKRTGHLVKTYEATPDVVFHGVACGKQRVHACDHFNTISSIS